MQVTGGDLEHISLMSPPTDNFGFFFTSKYPDAGISSSIRRDGLHIIYPPFLSYQLYADIAIFYGRGDDGGCVTTSVQRGLCKIEFFQRIYAYFA